MAKILLVEDDTDLQTIYSSRLEADGHTVITASDGEAGLAMALKELPDLIILDAMMPKIDGFDVLDMLRQTPQTEHTCIIMMTALGQDDYRKRGEALGVNRYFVKSQVSLDDLAAAVTQTLADGVATAQGATITPESPVINQQPAPVAPVAPVTPAPTVPVQPIPAPAAPAEPTPPVSPVQQ
jgi:twitching motility two-component system response regulator PilH